MFFSIKCGLLVGENPKYKLNPAEREFVGYIVEAKKKNDSGAVEGYYDYGLSEFGDSDIKKLVSYYKNVFKFYESEDDDLIIVKPDYDENCYGLIQEVKMLEKNREAVWHEFSDV